MDIIIALIVVVILSILDIIFTYKILIMYIKYNPKDENWADLEINKTGKLIFKKYGLGKESFIIQTITSIIFMIIFFGLIYIFDFDLEFFAYAAVGGLTAVNIIHYQYYNRLKNRQYPCDKE